MTSKIALFMSIFFVFSAQTAENRLLSLKDASVVRLKEPTEKPRISIVFQEKCSACRRQVRDLACLEKTADIVLIGAWSPEKLLRKEYRSFKTSFPGFYGDRAFRKSKGIADKVSPQTLLEFKDKKYKVIGYRSCDLILKQVEALLLDVKDKT